MHYFIKVEDEMEDLFICEETFNKRTLVLNKEAFKIFNPSNAICYIKRFKAHEVGRDYFIKLCSNLSIDIFECFKIKVGPVNIGDSGYIKKDNISTLMLDPSYLDKVDFSFKNPFLSEEFVTKEKFIQVFNKAKNYNKTLEIEYSILF